MKLLNAVLIVVGFVVIPPIIAVCLLEAFTSDATLTHKETSKAVEVGNAVGDILEVNIGDDRQDAIRKINKRYHSVIGCKRKLNISYQETNEIGYSIDTGNSTLEMYKVKVDTTTQKVISIYFYSEMLNKKEIRNFLVGERFRIKDSSVVSLKDNNIIEIKIAKKGKSYGE